MNRVKWKGPYVEKNLLKRVKNSKLISKNNVKTVSKNSIILPSFTELTFRVYNGKAFTNVKIIDEMVGHKLGEFAPTRTFKGHVKSDKKAKRR